MIMQLGFDVKDNKFLFSGKYEERIIIDRGRSFLYSPIPKCANTTIKVALKPEAYNNGAGASAVHMKGLFETLASLAPEERDDFLARAFKFIVVRNPFSRLLSAFRDKFETRGDGNGLWQNEYWKSFAVFIQCKLRERGVQTDDTGMTFREFVLFVCGTPSNLMNEHWHPQTLLGMFDQISYDLVIKYEQLSEGYAKVAERLGLGRLLKSEEVQFSPTHADLHLAKYYDAELEELVREKFHDDFSGLNYPTTVLA